MSVLTDEEVAKIVEIGLKTREFRILNHEIGKQREEMIGYMGNHLALTVSLFSKGNKLQRRFFIKTYNVEGDKENFVAESGMFQKEVDLYRVLLEDMRSFFGKSLWCPKYYYSKKRVLVLEDLSEEGFKTAAEGDSLDKPHLEAALVALSFMHASSILLEYRNSESLTSTHPNLFRELLYDESNTKAPSRRWLGWQIQDLLVAVEFLDKYSESEKKLIKEKFVGEIMRIYSLSKQSKKYRNVLTHGDLWRNNLLFQYSANVPVHCKLVDFQFCRFAPPAHDVMHLLHYSTKKAMRDQEEAHFLTFYYESLRKRLEAHGRDLRVETTWEEFNESCKEYKELALIQTLLSSHYLLGPVTLKVSVDDYDKYEEYLSSHRNEYMRNFLNKKSYADKVNDILYELIDGYIMQK